MDFIEGEREIFNILLLHWKWNIRIKTSTLNASTDILWLIQSDFKSICTGEKLFIIVENHTTLVIMQLIGLLLQYQAGGAIFE